MIYLKEPHTTETTKKIALTLRKESRMYLPTCFSLLIDLREIRVVSYDK